MVRRVGVELENNNEPPLQVTKKYYHIPRTHIPASGYPDSPEDRFGELVDSWYSFGCRVSALPGRRFYLLGITGET